MLSYLVHELYRQFQANVLQELFPHNDYPPHRLYDIKFSALEEFVIFTEYLLSVEYLSDLLQAADFEPLVNFIQYIVSIGLPDNLHNHYGQTSAANIQNVKCVPFEPLGTYFYAFFSTMTLTEERQEPGIPFVTIGELLGEEVVAESVVVGEDEVKIEPDRSITLDRISEDGRDERTEKNPTAVQPQHSSSAGTSEPRPSSSTLANDTDQHVTRAKTEAGVLGSETANQPETVYFFARGKKSYHERVTEEFLRSRVGRLSSSEIRGRTSKQENGNQHRDHINMFKETTKSDVGTSSSGEPATSTSTFELFFPEYYAPVFDYHPANIGTSPRMGSEWKQILVPIEVLDFDATGGVAEDAGRGSPRSSTKK
ncbi:unnamed protein product, partial [Amoebophrya sp. A120]|eukprot:GSA120T00008633001.1